jgi:hypothetical protein
LGSVLWFRVKTPKYWMEARRLTAPSKISRPHLSQQDHANSLLGFWKSRRYFLLIIYYMTGEYYAKLIPKDEENWRRGVLFHQDNGLAHKSCISMAVIHNAAFQIFQQPSYSPDLAPCDYFPFSKWKERLRGTHLNNGWLFKFSLRVGYGSLFVFRCTLDTDKFDNSINVFFYLFGVSCYADAAQKLYSEIFLINNCQCQNEVKNHTVPP